MRNTLGTKVRAIENYESKKEKWLMQVMADTELPAGALRVSFCIAVHMNRKQHMLAWPGLGKLQKLLGIDRSTVIRGVKALEARGHLRVVRSRTGAKNHPNITTRIF
jgi:DNA-binding MarR family transcriptional regulator